jgi:hypothetical protein
MTYPPLKPRRRAIPDSLPRLGFPGELLFFQQLDFAKVSPAERETHSLPQYSLNLSKYSFNVPLMSTQQLPGTGKPS